MNGRKNQYFAAYSFCWSDTQLLANASKSGLISSAVVRIGVAHKGASLPDGFFLYQNLTARGIAIKSIIPGQDGLVIRLETEEQRLATQKILKELLSDDYTTA